jgi:superoxide dismutase, Cu-Zn family
MPAITRLSGLALTAALLAQPGIAMAQTAPNQPWTPNRAMAVVKDAAGNEIGIVELSDVAGGVNIAGDFHGLPPGAHAVHIHNIGKCDAPTFQTSGTDRGGVFEAPDGGAAEDNLLAGPDGKGSISELETGTSVASGSQALLDAYGSAVVVLSAPDASLDAEHGNVDNILACGVLTELAPADNETVVITKEGFDPPYVIINAGGSVTWENDDSAVHNIKQNPLQAPNLDSGGLAPGHSYTQTFSTPGTFTYTSFTDCLSHKPGPTFDCAPATVQVVAAPSLPAEVTGNPTAGPSDAGIAATMNRTVEAELPDIHFRPAGPAITIDDGRGGGSLTAALGARFPAASGRPGLVFFWHGANFVGWDADTESQLILGVSSPAPGVFAVSYAGYAGTDPACCPSLAPVVVRYTWDGHRMVASSTPPRPRAFHVQLLPSA